MKPILGSPPARLAAGLAALPILGLAASPALGQHSSSGSARGPTRIEGTISVTISATRLKHWGVSGADAAFVPDGDGSAYAERIRSASSARALCDALSAADGRDRRIANASVVGDASLEHRSGDEELMRFVVILPNPEPATAGTLYICSQPVFAMMSRGAYPSESFYQVGEATSLWWRRYRLALRPGETVSVHLTASIDASEW